MPRLVRELGNVKIILTRPGETVRRAGHFWQRDDIKPTMIDSRLPKKKLHLDLLAIIRHLEWCYKHGGRGWMGWSRAVEERNRGSVFILLRLWIPPVMASVVGDKERLASSCSALLCLRRIHSAGFYFRLPQWISTSDACLIVELSSIELYRLDDFWSYHVEKLERPYVSTCLW